jgi:hypothetical protein
MGKKIGRNHGYWNRKYWELIEREQRMAMVIAGLIENEASYVWQIAYNRNRAS